MSYLQHRRKSFRTAAGGIPTPLHFWDLDDLVTAGGLADQGNGTNDMGLSAVATPTVDTGDSPDGGDSILFSTANQYLKTVSNYNWDGAGNAMSFGGWFKATSVSATFNSLMMWRQSTSSRILHLDIVNSSPDTARGIVFDNQTTEVLLIGSGTSTISLATWYHIFCVFDGVDTVEIFVDGTSEGTTTNASFADIESTENIPFAIGTASWAQATAALSHQGNVWACGIWDTVLTPAQISELYNNGSGGKYADYTWI